MPEIRTLPKVKCSCGGNIGYSEETDTFKCLSCGKPYSTEEEHITPPAQIKYSHTNKGKKQQVDWRHSEEGKKHIEDYDKSVKGKLARKKYYFSEKGQIAHQRHRAKVKQFKTLAKFLKDNPDKTIEDYLKEHPNEPTISEN